VVLNIYNTVHNYNIEKSGTVTENAVILEPQIQTNIWVASVDAIQKHTHISNHPLPLTQKWQLSVTEDTLCLFDNVIVQIGSSEMVSANTSEYHDINKSVLV